MEPEHVTTTITVGDDSVNVQIVPSQNASDPALELRITGAVHSLVVTVRINPRIGPTPDFAWSPRAHLSREFIRLARIAQLWAIDMRWELYVALRPVVQSFA